MELDLSSFNISQRKDIPAKSLKSLISNIENETDINAIIIKVKKIEVHLEGMNPTKCDINYQKYFTLLFKQIEKIPKVQRTVIKINIFLQLKRVFSDITSYLNYYNSNNKIIKSIHSLSSINDTIKFYCILTNNFIEFKNIAINDLIKIYECTISYLISKQSKNQFNFLKRFNQLIIILSNQLREIDNNKQMIGRTSDSPYIILVIESYIDIFIFFVMKYICDKEGATELENIIDIIGILFPAYIALQSNESYYNKLIVFKIVCILCLLYSYASSLKNENRKKIVDLFLILYNIHEKLILNTLFDIFYTMSRMDKDNNILLQLYPKNEYYSYFKAAFVSDTIDIINSLSPSYDSYMRQIVQCKSEYNIFKGCIAFISEIYDINNESITVRYPFILSLETIKIALTTEAIDIHCDIEMLYFISKCVSKKTSSFEMKELNIIIKIIILVSAKAVKKNTNSTYILSSFKRVLPILKNIMTKAKAIKNNQMLVGEIGTIVSTFASSISTFNKDFMEIVKEVCFHTNCENYQKLIEDYVVLSFIKIKKLQENEKQILFDNNLELFNEMNEIVISNDMQKCELIEQIIIKYYHEILGKVIKELPNQYLLLSVSYQKLIVNLIIHSKEKYKDLVGLIFQDIPYKEKDNILRTREQDFFRNIYKELLIQTNTVSYYPIVVLLIESSIKAKENIEEKPRKIKKKGKQNSIMQKIKRYFLKNCNIDEEGRIIFSSRDSKKGVVLYKGEHVQNESKYYIDIDYFIQLKLTKLRQLCLYESPAGKLKNYGNNPENYYFFFEKIIQTIYIFSPHILSKLLLTYIQNLKDNKMYVKAYLSLIHFLITCNYLLNYQTDGKYITPSEKQTNESIFIFDKSLMLKETIINNMITYYPKTQVKISNTGFPSYTNNPISFVLLSFFLNSVEQFNDKTLVPNSLLIERIDHIIVYLFYYLKPLHTFDFNHALLILTIFFTLKDILRYSSSSQLIKYIYILLVISRIKDYDLINDCFEGYCPIIKNNIKPSIIIFPEYQHFFYYFSDLVCLNYISYIDDDIPFFGKEAKSPSNKKNFYNSLMGIFQKKEIRCNRDVLFGKMCYMLLFTKEQTRDNTNSNEIISNIKQYQILFGKNSEIICYKENNNVYEYIFISPVSNLKLNIFPDNPNEIEITKDKVNSLSALYSKTAYSEKEENSNKIDMSNLIQMKFNATPNVFISDEKIKEKVCSILEQPVYFIYHVNVFYYPNKYDYLTIDNILEVRTSDDISPLYLEFISKFGNIYIDKEGNKELSYKDQYYNIIFDLVDNKPSREEKIELIKENSVNIIWLENPYIDIDDINSLFDSVSKDKDYTFITIAPKSKTHYLVRKEYKRVDKNNTVLENCFANNYFINTNAYSGIKYLINNIILLCDWTLYTTKKTSEYELQPREMLAMIEQDENYINNLIQRLVLIKSAFGQ